MKLDAGSTRRGAASAGEVETPESINANLLVEEDANTYHHEGVSVNARMDDYAIVKRQQQLRLLRAVAAVSEPNLGVAAGLALIARL